MGGAMKYFRKKLLGHEVFRSMVSWATKFFFKKFVKPSGPPPTHLMCTPLHLKIFPVLYTIAPLSQTIVLISVIFNHLKVKKKQKEKRESCNYQQ